MLAQIHWVVLGISQLHQSQISILWPIFARAGAAACFGNCYYCLHQFLELLCGGGRRRNGLCKVTFILSVASFLSLMSHFFSFFIPSECGIALQTALKSAVHITVPWSLICSVLILLSSAKLWLLVATGSLRRINDLLIPTVPMDANRHRQNVSLFHPFHTSLPNVLGCEMKSAHLALTSSTAAELEKTLSRGTCPSWVVGKWGFLKWPFQSWFSSVGWGIRQH